MPSRFGAAGRLACLTAAALALSAAAAAQAFDIAWNTIDCGGGALVSGGIFDVAGTIGQPDAGTVMTGGSFRVTGGFWPGVASAMPLDAPGDIDGDGDVDGADETIFVEVLIGNDSNPAHVMACDLNHDQAANGVDIKPFVAALMGG